MFIGEYYHSFDEKGRVNFPAKLREELGEQFVITKGLDGCLSAYSMEKWERMSEIVAGLPQAKARDLKGENFNVVALIGDGSLSGGEAYEGLSNAINLNSNFINDFINDTGFNIQFKKNNNRFHDRYIIIDFDTENEIIFHCGASSKDAGKRITTITKIEEQYIYKELVKDILNNENLVL